MDNALLHAFTQALADRYAIERELGRGGMATVFLARDIKHDRRVAIKVLPSPLARPPHLNSSRRCGTTSGYSRTSLASSIDSVMTRRYPNPIMYASGAVLAAMLFEHGGTPAVKAWLQAEPAPENARQTRPSRIVALLALLAGHYLLKGLAAKRERCAN